VRICGCCVWIRAGISVRVRIRVRNGVRISNRVRRKVKLVNYSLITALPIATSADPLFTRGRFLHRLASDPACFSQNPILLGSINFPSYYDHDKQLTSASISAIFSKIPISSLYKEMHKKPQISHETEKPEVIIHRHIEY